MVGWPQFEPNTLETHSTRTEKTFFLEACQSFFQANTFDLNDLSQLGLWLNKMESYCPSFLKRNINCGCHLDTQVQLNVLFTLWPPVCQGSTFYPSMP